jgi:hypothetical protein
MKILTLFMSLIVGGSLSAQIIYYDLVPDSVVTGLVSYSTGDAFFFDIDSNGVDDYEFVKVSYDTPDPVWDFGYVQDGGPTPVTNEFMGAPSSGLRQVYNLNAGDLISAAGPWETVAGGNSEFINVSPSFGTLSGLWLGDDDGYAALRFDSAGTQCYAWVRMGFAADHSTMTIKEWAYSCDDDLDSAGQMPSSPCLEPIDLTASAITINSADLGWTELNAASEWEVEYGVGPLTPGTGTFVTTSSNPLGVSALLDDTSYDFYVRSICGAGDTSDWSVLGTFETILDDVSLAEGISTEISVFPNPAEDYLNIQFNKNVSGEIQVFNLIGQRMQSLRLEGTSYVTMDVSRYSPGRYIYQIKADDILFHGKLLIE